MALYRARPEDGVAWVTGASTGIGRELALRLTRKGYVVAATARDEQKLATLVEKAAGQGGRILAYPCDVTDEAGMAETVAAIEKDAGPIVLAVFNAGIYRPYRGHKPDAAAMVQTFQVNVLGVTFGMTPVLERMNGRGYGHVAVMGSASAYFGLPSAAAYGASKAALNHFAASLRFDLEGQNIRIQIINPGFVDTELTEGSAFTMPALVPVGSAARRIVEGVASGGFEIAFPNRLIVPMTVMRLLPASLTHWLIDRIIRWDSRRTTRGKQAGSHSA